MAQSTVRKSLFGTAAHAADPKLYYDRAGGRGSAPASKADGGIFQTDAPAVIRIFEMDVRISLIEGVCGHGIFVKTQWIFVEWAVVSCFPVGGRVLFHPNRILSDVSCATMVENNHWSFV